MNKSVVTVHTAWHIKHTKTQTPMIYWNCSHSLKRLSTSNTNLYTARMGNDDSQNKSHIRPTTMPKPLN